MIKKQDCAPCGEVLDFCEHLREMQPYHHSINGTNNESNLGVEAILFVIFQFSSDANAYKSEGLK